MAFWLDEENRIRGRGSMKLKKKPLKELVYQLAAKVAALEIRVDKLEKKNEHTLH